MKRLALYAHYGPSPQVAKYVCFYLRQLQEFGFQIAFISNSSLSPESEAELKKFSARIITRENAGYDFAMWRHGLADFNLNEFDELLLTNSSIIGPLHPLTELWKNPALADCDFWGLTDNDEMGVHLQSYFLVFRPQVFRSECFAGFWQSVLSFRDKDQAIRSYELGLTCWLAENGFKWKAAFPGDQIRGIFRTRQDIFKKIRRRVRGQTYAGRNTTLYQPDILHQCGMPFVKLALLRETGLEFSPEKTMTLLQKSGLPPEVLEDLRRNYVVGK